MDQEDGNPALSDRILLIRGQRVMLDVDLAQVYGVTTARLNQQVQRNIERFPEDFMFQLTRAELNLMLHFATSRSGGNWGGRRKLPYAFTHVGAATLSAVLRSPGAVRAHIAIMRAFDGMQRTLALHKRLAARLDDLERRHAKHDEQLQEIFGALRELMEPQPASPRRIGFKP